jgi:hypothetical protein
MIYLYHGTNAEFASPDPKRGRRGTDFGQGFYLTPNFDSARRMAERVARRQGTAGGVVLCYSLEDSVLSDGGLQVRTFLDIDAEWLRFVVANRYADSSAVDHNLDARWDVVHGLVADDRVVQILDDLRRGFSTEEEVLRKLRAAPFRTVQYSFHTTRAIERLRLTEVKHV